MGHIARNCPRRRTESRGHPAEKPRTYEKAKTNEKPRTFAKQVQAAGGQSEDARAKQVDPLDLLYSTSSSSEESDVRMVRVADQGSHPQCAKVQIQGVPAFGIIDSGADITIMGGKLFKKVAAVARLKRRNFKKADKTPRTYDRKPFTLDGRMDLDVSFGGTTMQTPVYIKMDAPDQLLLSEGVCRQLGLISYHPDVQQWRGGRKQPQPTEDAKVPTVRVKLVQSIQLSPLQSAVVQVHVDTRGDSDPVYVEHDPTFVEETGLCVDDTLLQPDKEGLACLIVSNPSAYTQVADRGVTLGEVIEAAVVRPGESQDPEEDPVWQEDTLELQSREEKPVLSGVEVRRVHTDEDIRRRKEKLREVIPEPELLDPGQKQGLYDFLTDHHQAFCLDEHERGETDLVEFQIDTGDASPKKQPARRMPFAVRQEVARQLNKMQESGVIQPSSSPWASPVVLVKKKDGSHRFCVDYRELNSATKADTFPLPRIDDLLDQLGKSRFFSTLDLASGYWQIRVHPDSQEKTAFVTPQGLYEFRVMPFGPDQRSSRIPAVNAESPHGIEPRRWS